jgi:hypothetical protein
MVEDYGKDFAQKRFERLEEPDPIFGVLHDFQPLFLGESSLFSEDGFGDFEFTDVVQFGSGLRGAHLVRGKAHFQGDVSGDSGYSV